MCEVYPTETGRIKLFVKPGVTSVIQINSISGIAIRVKVRRTDYT